MTRIIAMIPTWNEAENIGSLLEAILALGPEYEALVVDDDSPDGTWQKVLDRAQGEPRIHLLRRFRNRGRGLAGIAGFREALRLGADLVVEMDADWSHDPKWIHSLVRPVVSIPSQADVVVGSRLIPGGGEQGRSAARRFITHLANFYIRTMLRLPVRDATSGFRVFARRCLEALPWDAMQATGPEVVQEVLLAAHARGFTIVEQPIVFVERRAGVSTFNRRIMWRSLWAMARLRWKPGRLVSDATPANISYAPGDDSLLPLPRPLMLPLAFAYGLGRRLLRLLAVSGLRPRCSLPVPVACVGNLTVGGTGKTPFVQLLAETLQRLGHRPAILSRGYGATERHEAPVIVSDGRESLATAEAAGDEPLLLARNCAGVPVVTSPDRHRAGQLALRSFGSDLLILDDGFQHDRLRRDLDIVLWDLSDLPSRMRLLPAGRLREGLRALGRAGAIVMTHAEYVDPQLVTERRKRVLRELKHFAPHVPVFEAQTEIAGYERLSGRIRGESGQEGPPYPWTGRRVLAVSGVARPRGFEAMLTTGGAQVCRHFTYPDHYTYDTWLFDDWREAMLRENAEMIVTTAKDGVKLSHLPMFGIPLVAMRIAMRVTEPRRWELFLTQRLTDARTAPRPAPAPAHSMESASR